MKMNYNEEYILKLICYYYGIKNPIVKYINNNEDYREFYVSDSKGLSYTVRINNDQDMPILVKLSNKDYIDTFKIAMRGFAIHTGNVYENKDKDVIFKKKFYKLNRSFIEKENNSKVYNTHNYIFKNNYLDCNILLSIPSEYQFDDNLFAKSIIDYEEEIKDIEMLYHLIKELIGLELGEISITNNKESTGEKIRVSFDKLMEYKRIKGNKIFEYKEGSREFTITEINRVSLEDNEFQKVLKMIRS